MKAPKGRAPIECWRRTPIREGRGRAAVDEFANVDPPEKTPGQITYTVEVYLSPLDLASSSSKTRIGEGGSRPECLMAAKALGQLQSRFVVARAEYEAMSA